VTALRLPYVLSWQAHPIPTHDGKEHLARRLGHPPQLLEGQTALERTHTDIAARCSAEQHVVSPAGKSTGGKQRSLAHVPCCQHQTLQRWTRSLPAAQQCVPSEPLAQEQLSKNSHLTEL